MLLEIAAKHIRYFVNAITLPPLGIVSIEVFIEIIATIIVSSFIFSQHFGTKSIGTISKDGRLSRGE